MKRSILSIAACVTFALVFTACNDEEKKTEPGTEPVAFQLKGESSDYSADGNPMRGYVAFNEKDSSKRPIVLVVPEWWGVTDYTRSRAKQLAELGYLAFVVDMYGDGKVADNPDSAGKYATPFYSDISLAKSRFDAALAKAKSYPNADTSKVAAIGYCFGGSMVLNMAKIGENLDAVVSFHGNLAGVPPSKETLKAKILVLHGEADGFIKPEELANFRKELDSVKADYIFKSYPNAMHAFTNPDATATGEKFKIPIKYDAAADTASWKEMKTFLADVLK
ncbi:MAG: dienelactone hydrolase family protein [Chryseobacterium sp.]|nr:MAG: dienelactone hydrolase family protein [Chryseobacterium sp.]